MPSFPLSSRWVGWVQKLAATPSSKNKTKAGAIWIDTTNGYVLKYDANGTVAQVSTSLAAATHVTETVTATNVITASENGKTFYLNSTTEFVSTLPAPFDGGFFTFVVVGAPSGASYTVVGASGTPIHGMVLSKDLNGATDSGATAGTGVLTLTFVDGKSQKGDTAVFRSDGTSWYVIASTGGAFDSITLS